MKMKNWQQCLLAFLLTATAGADCFSSKSRFSSTRQQKKSLKTRKFYLMIFKHTAAQQQQLAVPSDDRLLDVCFGFVDEQLGFACFDVNL